MRRSTLHALPWLLGSFVLMCAAGLSQGFTAMGYLAASAVVGVAGLNAMTEE